MSLGLNTLHFNSILFCAPPPRPTSALNFPQTRSCWCLLKLSVLPFYFRYKFNKTHNGSFQIHQIWSASAVNVEPSPTVRAVLMLRLNLVKIWFSENAFFIFFFTGRAFIIVNYIVKLVSEFLFDLRNPRKQPKM